MILPLVSHAAQCLTVLYYSLLCELTLVRLPTLLLKHIGWFLSLLYTLARVSFPASRTLLTGWGSSCFSEEEECRELSLHIFFPHRLKKHLFQSKWSVFSHWLLILNPRIVSFYVTPKGQAPLLSLGYWLTQRKINQSHNLCELTSPTSANRAHGSPINPQQWRLACFR